MTDKSVYTRTTIQAQQDGPVRIRLGLDDRISVWLNGRKLKTLRRDDNDFHVVDIPADLKRGPKELMLKIANFLGPRQAHRLFALSCVTC